MSTAFYGYSPVALVRVCRITDLGNGAYGLGVGLLGQKVGTPAGTAPPEPLPSQAQCALILISITVMAQKSKKVHPLWHDWKRVKAT